LWQLCAITEPWVCVSRASRRITVQPTTAKKFAKLLRRLGIKHIRTRPYTPRTNGKAERFIQTLLREWAYAYTYPVLTPERRSCPIGLLTTISTAVTHL
jgi:transposase InsO family protein